MNDTRQREVSGVVTELRSAKTNLLVKGAARSHANSPLHSQPSGEPSAGSVDGKGGLEARSSRTVLQASVARDGADSVTATSASLPPVLTFFLSFLFFLYTVFTWGKGACVSS